MENNRIHVLQEYQGNKVGQLLIDYALEIAHQRQITYILVRSMGRKLQSARILCEK
jgi:GNAT superfamily N-acetyltransferase